ncbi:MAG: tRNA adenylyltransferase [Planctomycetaceae bacterium]
MPGVETSWAVQDSLSPAKMRRKHNMVSEKLRRQILFEAARLMYQRRESEYYRAKLKAAKRICRGWIKSSDLPSNAEIREEVLRLAHTYEGDSHREKLREMRISALWIMRVLAKFRPRLIGSTWTGHIRQGSDIDIHVFSTSAEAIAAALDAEGLTYDVERKRISKHGEERVFTHIHVQDRFPIELTVYSPDKVNYVFKSSITGKAIERASIEELEMLLRAEYPDLDLDQETLTTETGIDRFQVYRTLMLPLSRVKEHWKNHPEGDVLHHSLQVYDLACDELPYDEEFQLAALLHDVGKGINPHDHVQAGLEALGDFITPRTAWLIEHHMEAHKVRDGMIGARARRRLQESEDFEELMLLEQCDRLGRIPGKEVPDLDDALEELRELSRTCGWS